jgi:hypothetical protein
MGKATKGGNELQWSERVSKVRKWAKWESELGFQVFIPLISNCDLPSYEGLMLLGPDRKAANGLQAGPIRNDILKCSRRSFREASWRRRFLTKFFSLTSHHRFLPSHAARPPQKTESQCAAPRRVTWTSSASFLQLLGLEVREHRLLTPTTGGCRGEQTRLCSSSYCWFDKLDWFHVVTCPPFLY